MSNSIITERNLKTHRNIFFTLNNKEELMKIEFKYSPTIAEDEKNILQAFENGCCSLNEEESKLEREKFLNKQENLKNLITLSLYYEDEYIGCAHRHSGNQTIVISSGVSTDGFIKTPIKAGQWLIVISIHAIYVDNIEICLGVSVG